MIELGMAGKARPAVVISRHDPDAPRALTVLAPMTTKPRGGRYEVAFVKPRWLPLESVIDVQGVRSMVTVELGRKLGVLPSAVMQEVKTALRYAFEI